MTGSLSCHKQVAGTTRGWESPVKGASYKVRHRSSLCITNQAVWVRERRGRAGRRDPPLNELLDHLHACIELIQGENVLLGEEPQPWTLPEVLQGQQRQSYRGPASSWGRQTAHTCTHTSNDPHGQDGSWCRLHVPTPWLCGAGRGQVQVCPLLDLEWQTFRLVSGHPGKLQVLWS